jgi:hypothetical protein
MRVVLRKGKYIGYDDDGYVVIISTNKNIVREYMKGKKDEV